MDFMRLPAESCTLRNVTIPGSFKGKADSLIRADIGIKDGVIGEASGLDIDMAGALVLPAFVDMHTHIDKGHILPRADNPDGSFLGALNSVRDDHANWTADDVYRRADFSLRCAYAHGTRALRTHLDSIPPQDEITWPVFDQLRSDWRGRIDLQGVCLAGCDSIDLSGKFKETARLVQQFEGVLGLAIYPMPALDELLTKFFSLAARLDLDVDLHVDETLDDSVECLRNVCNAVIDTGFSAKVTVGHICSLSVQSEERALNTLDLVAKAGLHVVSLPMCNLYLQDRASEHTPRRRGVTLVHELKQRGVPVSFASDNTRDPFYAYGDMDMLEVLREATRIAHLDHSAPDWINAFITFPASACGFSAPSLEPGVVADLVICRARNWTELLSRPQSDRIVLRNGLAIDRTLPDYAELDDLFKDNAAS